MARLNVDLLGAIFLLVIGVGICCIAWGYPMGSINQMGPGYFPMVLGVALAGIGLALFAKGVKGTSVAPLRVEWRPLIAILAALLAFMAALYFVGLAPAVVLCVLISAWGDRSSRPASAFLTAIATLIFVWLVFVLGLGLPMPLLRVGL